ncbi:SHOCT domain-containing protein [Ornithinimicrobium sp. F0845]|uniref:SHOCT domain-containing protein n=1 Tax=Ornithinimicrobium sp. F0845 TaxID=2926412 RepID=UPI001FF19090|nr:SHOCT domain-containing protein [Ornithinimicrobium sp. F0845]MCK0111633.1 SHOCT domain-containing protein [Ornithinimicrobium sp. F0845]
MGFLDFMLWFLWVWFAIVCIWAYIWIVIDVFRDHTLNGWAKAGWLILLVLLPFLGALIYLIARGGSIASRQARDVSEAQQAHAEYIRSVVGTASPGTEIERAQSLLTSGAITQAEFDSLKARALA